MENEEIIKHLNEDGITQCFEGLDFHDCMKLGYQIVKAVEEAPNLEITEQLCKNFGDFIICQHIPFKVRYCIVSIMALHGRGSNCRELISNSCTPEYAPNIVHELNQILCTDSHEYIRKNCFAHFRFEGKQIEKPQFEMSDDFIENYENSLMLDKECFAVLNSSNTKALLKWWRRYAPRLNSSSDEKERKSIEVRIKTAIIMICETLKGCEPTDSVAKNLFYFLCSNKLEKKTKAWISEILFKDKKCDEFLKSEPIMKTCREIFQKMLKKNAEVH